MSFKTFFEIKQQTEDTATVFIYDSIGGYGITADDFRREVDRTGAKTLKVRISSNGGYLTDGVAIYNYIKDYPGKVITQVDSIAASIASLIAMAGQERLIAETGALYLHKPWTGVEGNADDMRETADTLDFLQGALVKGYADATGLTESDIDDMLNARTWIGADRAVELGFATAVASDIRAAAKVDLSTEDVPEQYRALLDGSAKDQDALETPETPETPDEDKTEPQDTPEDTSEDQTPEDTPEDKTPEDTPEDTHQGQAIPETVAELYETDSPLATTVREAIDAAYDEGQAQATQEAVKAVRDPLDAEIDALKATLAKQRENYQKEIDALKKETDALKVEHDKITTDRDTLSAKILELTNGAVAPEPATDQTWSELVNGLGYTEARKQYPEKYADYMQDNREKKKNKTNKAWTRW